MTQPLCDYGKLYVGAGDYRLAAPDSLTGLRDCLSEALAADLPIRVRGSGHSLSGMSLPRSGELLLRTHGLDHYHFERPGTLTVGSGAILWDVRDFVARHGWQLPVYNGGWAGPTVGGYICAGGMGLRVPPSEREKAMARDSGGPSAEQLQLLSVSEVHGGFWEHVESVAFIDGTGTLHRIFESDPAFPWIFASYGQFGVIVEATLKLLPAHSDGAPGYPLGETGRIPRVQSDDPAVNDTAAPESGTPWLYWFSYLVPESREAAAWRVIDDWIHTHAHILKPQGGWVGPSLHGAPVGYRYVVRHKRFHPPLLYPHDSDFVLMGVMALCEGIGRSEREDALRDAERAFVEAALTGGWQLYPQAENLSRGLDFRRYYGDALYARFRDWKTHFDPRGRINPGEVFDDGTRPPARMASLRRVARAMRRLIPNNGG